MNRYKVNLLQDERAGLEAITRKGSHQSQKVINALILLNGNCQASCRLNVFVHAAILCAKSPFLCSSLMC